VESGTIPAEVNVPESPLHQPRIFTYTEAVALLPEVRRITERARDRVEAISETTRGEQERSRAADDVVREWAQSIMELGIEVKGLWLVDFDNGSGYYCWRYPEAGLDYFHSYEDGFGGRLRIQ
jgi:hypothetical protein